MTSSWFQFVKYAPRVAAFQKSNMRTDTKKEKNPNTKKNVFEVYNSEIYLYPLLLPDVWKAQGLIILYITLLQIKISNLLIHLEKPSDV